MVFSRVLVLVLGVVVVSGCVAPQKLVMTPMEHKQFVVQLEGTRWCGQLGLMDLDTASRGMGYLSTTAANYAIDPYLVDSITKQLRAEGPPSAETCNSFAMHILDRKRHIAQSNASVEASQKAWSDIVKATRPTQTYCNKIGTQTLCNTY